MLPVQAQWVELEPQERLLEAWAQLEGAVPVAALAVSAASLPAAAEAQLVALVLRRRQEPEGLEPPEQQKQQVPVEQVVVAPLAARPDLVVEFVVLVQGVMTFVEVAPDQALAQAQQEAQRAREGVIEE